VIIGLGSDLIDIRRIEHMVERHGERFTVRVFTQIERARAEARGDRVASYAKRFAAKEACAKALGTGIAKGVFWSDMCVVNLDGGKPTLEVSGGAQKHLEKILPPGMRPVIHVTITDDYPLAQAFVIIEALPA
jgi:holo-[acyl-carrier protein] synthase